ncbi:MAG TPA: phosphatase PAP2 family protein [Bacteroidota bacterium]|nr:phosphatase PAP2 family protein [Bacteroidota bacterium]
MNFRARRLALLAAVIGTVAPLRAQEEDPPQPESYGETVTEFMLQDADSSVSIPPSGTGGSSLRWYSMVTNIPGDWAGVGSAAFRASNLPLLGGIALATGALMVADRQTYSFSHDLYLNSPGVKFASNQIVRAGDGKYSLGLAAAFAVYGFAWSDQRALRTASNTVEALLASGIAVQVLKHIAGRESPQVVHSGTGKWRPFPSLAVYNRNQPRYYAFPSGHVTTAMATVTVIAENYPEVGWIRPAGYGIVGLTAIGLVNKGWHWYSDFPMALALGYTFGHLAAHRDDPSDGDGLTDSGEATTLHVLPGAAAGGAGVTLALTF